MWTPGRPVRPAGPAGRQPLRFSGPTVRFANVQCRPRPVQGPHPPIVMGGNRMRPCGGRGTAATGGTASPSARLVPIGLGAHADEVIATAERCAEVFGRAGVA